MADVTSALDADLPLPTTDTGRLGDAVRSLHPVATRATEPMAAGAPHSWWGGSRMDAEAEVARLRTIAADLGVRADAARLALAAYVSAIVNTRGTILGLREQWLRGHQRQRLELERLGRIEREQQAPGAILSGAALTVDVPARERAVTAEWSRLCADLGTRHRTAMRGLEAERGRCVAVLRSTSASIPGADPAGIRAAVLATVPLAGAAVRADEAKRLLDDLVRRAGVPPTLWDQRQAPLLAELEGRITDPFVARELIRLLGPQTLGNLTERLVSAGTHTDDPRSGQVRAALRVLGAALLTAANPASDPAPADDRDAVRAWRSEWLRGLATLVDQPVGLFDHQPPFLGTHAIGVLLGAGREALPGGSPGADFARTVGLAMVRDDIAAGRYATRRDPIHSPTACDIDPIALLLAALKGDVPATRALLLQSIGDGRVVVDHLVSERILRPHAGVNNSTVPLADLIAEATSDGSDAAAELAAHLLTALARTGAEWRTEPGARDAINAEVDPLRRIAGQLLAGNLDLFWKLAARPTGDQSLTIAGDDGRRRPNIGTRLELSDLLTQLALDGVVPGRTQVRTTAAPAFAALLDALIAHHARDVAAALAGGNDAAKEAAIRRFGSALGFVVTSATRGLASGNGTVDEQNARGRQLVGFVVDRLQIPGPVKANIPAGVAAIAVDKLLALAKDHITEDFADAHPIDYQARTEAEARTLRRDQREELSELALDLASATATWPAAQAPAEWGRAHPHRVPFWGPDGRPLPYAAMTLPGQRDAFLDWSRDLPDFARLPGVLRESIRDGTEAAA